MPQINTSAAESPRLLVGRDATPPEPVELLAGAVSVLLYEGDLRHVRLGDVELAQRVYVAVRDAVWNTIPGSIENLEVATEGKDGFEVTFACRHLYEDIDFVWRARIRGEAGGAITYEMAGAPQAVFQFAKIGLNIHHPLRECLGRPYRAYRDGVESRGFLPTDIEPQLVVDGTLTALFPAYDALVIELADGLEVRFDFEGDLFEMQDHRNWTDANLKSYGTPLSLPWPFTAKPGQEIRQSVRITFTGAAPGPHTRPAATEIEVGEPGTQALPPIGLGLAELDGGGLTARETELLAATRPAHVRVDLVLDDPELEERLARSTEAARALGTALELAIFTGAADASEARRVLAVLERDPARVARVFVFAGWQGFSSTSGLTTSAALVHAVREALAPGLTDVPFIGGTNQFFTEINRNRPETNGVDGVVYSLNPQVHAADDLSLMENLEAQADTVVMAGKVASGLRVFVSPITLIGRYGPFPAGPPLSGGLPGNVDLRHTALFGAAWTVASIRRLAESGAAALTYYETTGLRGLIHSGRDAELAGASGLVFAPGDAFPVYHVFADLAADTSLRLVRAQSSDRSTVEVLAVQRDDRNTLLLANLTQYEQPVDVRLAHAAETTARAMDLSVARVAIHDPQRFRSDEYETVLGYGNRFKLALAPYAVVRIDTNSASPASGGEMYTAAGAQSMRGERR